MNQSPKQPVGTSKFTRPAHERLRFLTQKLLLSTKSEMTVILHPGGGGGLQMDRNDQTTGMIKGFFGV